MGEPESIISEDQYVIIWSHGSLGLLFGEDPASKLPIISKITSKKHNNIASLGDTMMALNEYDARDYSFREFFGILGKLKKPVAITFSKKDYQTRAELVESLRIEEEKTKALQDVSRAFAEANGKLKQEKYDLGAANIALAGSNSKLKEDKRLQKTKMTALGHDMRECEKNVRMLIEKNKTLEKENRRLLTQEEEKIVDMDDTGKPDIDWFS